MADKILSVFIDESGDFGPYDSASPYYLVALVFHDQSVDIQKNIAVFDAHLKNLGYPKHIFTLARSFVENPYMKTT